MDVTKKEITDTNGKPMVFLESPKFTQALVIYKENNGFPFFAIRWGEKGEVPLKLKGSYLKLTDAERDIREYFRTSKTSRAKRTNDVTALREQRKKKQS